MSNAKTLTITIGRNVSRERISDAQTFGNVVQVDLDTEQAELTEKAWNDFISDVVFVVGVPADSLHTGRGVWCGIPEDSAILSWFEIEELTPRKLAILSDIRFRYGQDAVAVTFSSPDFI